MNDKGGEFLSIKQNSINSNKILEKSYILVTLNTFRYLIRLLLIK